jgi:hypothetical protein
MGNRQDDRSARIGTRNVGPGPGGGRAPEPQRDYGASRDYARAGGAGYANEGLHEDHDAGGFLSEDVPGHVPNQRWSGGYGGDRDREAYGYGPSGPPSGRGFTGNDFGGLPPRLDRGYGAPVDLGPRHFGNEVDLGGRSAPGGPMPGYGYRGTDMGMGAPERDEARGPHYGKGPKGYKRSDERIHEDVCDAIAGQGYIDASDVEVKVADGAVTLSGTVAHRQDKRRLEHLAEQCRGVHDIHNELRLKRVGSSPGQDKLARPAEISDGSTNGNTNGKTTRSS